MLSIGSNHFGSKLPLRLVTVPQRCFHRHPVQNDHPRSHFKNRTSSHYGSDLTTTDDEYMSTSDYYLTTDLDPTTTDTISDAVSSLLMRHRESLRSS